MNVGINTQQNEVLKHRSFFDYYSISNAECFRKNGEMKLFISKVFDLNR